MFYLTPNKFADQSKPWYSLVPVGRNRVVSMLKDMCAETQVSGNFTNHSLRAYGATTLYHANLTKKLIQERTGHRCLKALRQYDRTSDSQLVEVSNIIISNKVQAAALSSVPCSQPKMEICKNDRVVSHKSNKMILPMQQDGPSIAALLKGCNFSNCNVTFTGSGVSTEESKCK